MNLSINRQKPYHWKLDWLKTTLGEETNESKRDNRPYLVGLLLGRCRKTRRSCQTERKKN